MRNVPDSDMYARLTFAMLCLWAAGKAVFGLDVDCRPGVLSSLLENPAGVESLSVCGSIDGRDLRFIARHMPALRTLDLEAATIASEKGLPSFPDGVFMASALESIGFPRIGRITIGEYAFAGCALTELSLPENVEEIGFSAFAACPCLEEVHIAGSPVSGGHVFDSCPALERVVMSHLRVVGNYDFSGCGSLSECDTGENLISVGESAFAGTALETFRMSSSEHADVGEWAFSGIPLLRDFSMAARTGSIGVASFFGDSSLSGLDIPFGDCLPDYALYGASVLENLVIPEGVTHIGRYAAKGCKSVSAVKLPSTVVWISDYAMEDMQGLKSIDATSLDGVPELGQLVWQGVDCGKATLCVAPGMTENFRCALQWQDFDIVDSSTGLLSQETGHDNLLTACFEGDVIRVSSSDKDILRLELYAPDGRCLCISDVRAREGRVDTSFFGGALFIVRASLSDGCTESIKLIRTL